MKKLFIIVTVVLISACSPHEPDINSANIQGGAINSPATSITA